MKKLISNKLSAEHITTYTSVFVAIISCIFSGLMWRANRDLAQFSNSTLSLERYGETIALCNSFNAAYRHYNLPSVADMVMFRLWEDPKVKIPNRLMPIRDSIDRVFSAMSKEEKMDALLESEAFDLIFGSFEQAAILHRKGLLDTDYFNCYYSALFGRLSTAQNPSLEEMLEYKRKKVGRDDIWNGYEYCKDNLLYDLIMVPNSVPKESAKVIKVYVQEGAVVSVGQKIMRVKYLDKDVVYRSQINGVVNAINVKEGDSALGNMILVEIRPMSI